MKVSQADDRHPRTVYDRRLLLFGVKRDAVLDLWEVERYGLDSFADADYVSVYGMRPADWYARGIRLLGRTTVECTRDALADAIALDVADLARSASSTSGALVIDPFVGSGNTLYWIVRRLTGCIGRGLELDARVCELTKRNLAIINSPIQIVNTDYLRGLAATTTPPDRLVVVFIAPPGATHSTPRPGSTCAEQPLPSRTSSTRSAGSCPTPRCSWPSRSTSNSNPRHWTWSGHAATGPPNGATTSTRPDKTMASCSAPEDGRHHRRPGPSPSHSPASPRLRDGPDTNSASPCAELAGHAPRRASRRDGLAGSHCCGDPAITLADPGPRAQCFGTPWRAIALG